MLQMKQLSKKFLSGMTAVMLMVSSMSTTGFAAELPSEAGTYGVDAELSCYISAMGGIEFAGDMVTGTTVTVDGNGDAKMTIGLATNSLTIYGVACDAFIDATSVTPGYYDENGVVQTAEYTLSSNTAVNPAKENVNYVDSVTFPVSEDKETYYLWLYVNSNVMGCQFGNGEGTGSSNQAGVATPYKAEVTVDWDSIGNTSDSTGSDIVKTSTTDVAITYKYQVVEPTYEVSIPSTIDIPVNANGIGEYTITLDSAANFANGDYVTISAPTSGKLVSNANYVNYANSLSNTKLSKAGDSATGKITIETPPAAGTYTGTVTFTINYHSPSTN